MHASSFTATIRSPADLAMAELENKENMSPVGHLQYPSKRSSASPSPSPARAKANVKGRSKSIGPGGLDGIEEQPRKSPKHDRRKVAMPWHEAGGATTDPRQSSFAPTVKSILPSKDEEAKRREARRKSLANRRVSFAPEATLHTWDVIEYMRDATTSSGSSENTRSASSPSRDSNDQSSDPPSTPPEQAENESTLQPTSPAHQRDLHQKKRRRSSAVPPMNFNNPDDSYSSSPVSNSSPLSGSEQSEDGEEEESDGEAESTAMSLDTADNTGTMRSIASTDSSARLDAALREAAHQAGTRGIDFDEHGDMTMEMATEDVTSAFKPWAQQDALLPPLARNLVNLQEQENINPFSPAFRAHTAPRRPSTIAEEEDDMSMDMTRAVGGIMRARNGDESMQDVEDGIMDFTQTVGKILQAPTTRPPQLKSALKRRLSTTDQGSPAVFKSPRKHVEMRDSKRRRSSASSVGDSTMDLTMAAGGIQRGASPVKQTRRASLRRRRSSGQSSATGEQTMDFTTAMGGIRQAAPSPARRLCGATEEDEDEDLSMELTTALGTIAEILDAEEISQPMTPRHTSSPLRTEVPTTPKDQARFKEASDLSAKKLLTPVFDKKADESPVQYSARSSKTPVKMQFEGLSSPRQARTPSQSPRRGVAKSPRSALPVDYPSLPPFEAPLTPQPSTPHVIAPSEDGKTQPRQGQVLEAEFLGQNQTPSTPWKAEASPLEVVFDSKVVPRSISDNIKLLSTPRKDTGTSPLKRLKNLTPKKTPLKTALTPGKTPMPVFKTPSIAAKFVPVNDATQQLRDDLVRATSEAAQVERVQLSQFLDMAGIRFMDLTTSKRRFTTAPTPAKAKAASSSMTGAAEDDSVPDLGEALVAGACTVPELNLYQHSCRELKHYISEGKSFLKTMETEVYEHQPPFIQTYVSASPKRRSELDGHMRDMKSNARLRSKEIWYGWRSKLLEGLQDGLHGIHQGFKGDAEVLNDSEGLVDSLLPLLAEQRESLQAEAQRLEEDAAAVSEEDKAELDEARERLVSISDEIEERRREVALLRQELEEQDILGEAYAESKAECLGAIEESERVRESCRGWSVEEVATLQRAVTQLEQSTGWSITTAASTSITMVYRNQLELFFDTGAFQNTAATSRSPSKSSPKKSANRPISLTYIASSREHHPEALTTDKRFFLQLMRAQLQCLDQHATRIKDLLGFVSSGWDTATSINKTIGRLDMENMADASILSDERLGVQVALLLPKVETKVQLQFELSASVAAMPGESNGFELAISNKATGKVVYGEQYKEQKMGEFIMSRIGHAAVGWEDAVRELKVRLVATGRKGH